MPELDHHRPPRYAADNKWGRAAQTADPAAPVKRNSPGARRSLFPPCPVQRSLRRCSINTEEDQVNAEIEVPAEDVDSFRGWILSEVMRYTDDPGFTDEKREQSGSLAEAAKHLADQGLSTGEGQPVTFTGSVRVLSDSADFYVTELADLLECVADTSPVDYPEVRRLAGSITRWSHECERLDAIDRRKAVA